MMLILWVGPPLNLSLSNNKAPSLPLFPPLLAIPSAISCVLLGLFLLSAPRETGPASAMVASTSRKGLRLQWHKTNQSFVQLILASIVKLIKWVTRQRQTDRRWEQAKAGPVLIREKLSFGSICKRLIGTGCPHACEGGLIASSEQSLFVWLAILLGIIRYVVPSIGDRFGSGYLIRPSAWATPLAKI